MSMAVKQRLKGGLQLVSANQHIPPIVIASMGRSGSTLVYDAVVDAVIASSPLRRIIWPKKLTADWSWTLGEKALQNGVVYKSHDYPDRLKGTKARCLFLFGSCLDAATSVHSAIERFGPAWVNEHFERLKSDGSFSELFDRDVLGFESQIRSWATTEVVPTLCLRFDSLWANNEKLNDFLGMRVRLPPRRPRKIELYDTSVLKALKAVYSSIDTKAARLPDAFLSKADNKHYFE
jgi:hypothetical protein